MIDHIRKHKRMDYVEEIDEAARGGTADVQVDVKEAIEKALAKLPEVQKSVYCFAIMKDMHMMR